MTYTLEQLLAMTPAERVRPFREVQGWICRQVDQGVIPPNNYYAIFRTDNIRRSPSRLSESDAWAAATPSAEEIMQCADELNASGFRISATTS